MLTNPSLGALERGLSEQQKNNLLNTEAKKSTYLNLF